MEIRVRASERPTSAGCGDCSPQGAVPVSTLPTLLGLLATQPGTGQCSHRSVPSTSTRKRTKHKLLSSPSLGNLRQSPGPL